MNYEFRVQLLCVSHDNNLEISVKIALYKPSQLFNRLKILTQRLLIEEDEIDSLERSLAMQKVHNVIKIELRVRFSVAQFSQVETPLTVTLILMGQEILFVKRLKHCRKRMSLTV